MTVPRVRKFPVAGLWVRLAHARHDRVGRAGRREVAARFNTDGEDHGQQKARRDERTRLTGRQTELTAWLVQQRDTPAAADVTEWGKTNPASRRVEGKSYFFFGTDPEYVVLRQEANDYATAVYEATR